MIFCVYKDPFTSQETMYIPCSYILRSNSFCVFNSFEEKRVFPLISIMLNLAWASNFLKYTCNVLLDILISTFCPVISNVICTFPKFSGRNCISNLLLFNFMLFSKICVNLCCILWLFISRIFFNLSKFLNL